MLTSVQSCTKQQQQQKIKKYLKERKKLRLRPYIVDGALKSEDSLPTNKNKIIKKGFQADGFWGIVVVVVLNQLVCHDEFNSCTCVF